MAETRDYAIFALDLDGRVATWNAGAERFKGYSEAEILGQHFSVFYPEEDVAAGKPQRELEIAAAEGHLEDEGWRVRQDGSRFWASVVITGLHGSDGSLRGFGKVTRDLTERRLADEAAARGDMERRQAYERLSAAEEQFRTIIDHAPFGIALITPDGRWLRVNRALCDITGYAEGELLATSLTEMTHPDDLDADRAQVRKLLAGEISSYELEKRYFRANGSTVSMSLSVALVRDNAGEPAHFVFQFQDITERKRYERSLRQLADRDPMSGLANRRTLSGEMLRAFDHLDRYGESLGFLMIDLDHFGDINDSYAHRVGDQMIRAVADALADRMRATDTLARFGGDEFAILMPRANLYTLERVASELVELIGSIQIVAGDSEVRCSASIGAVLVSTSGEFDEDSLIAAAELAVYEAKDAGPGRFGIYDKAGGSQVRSSARSEWSRRIRAALENDAFELHLQPVVDLATGTAGHFEALIRLEGPGGELVLPGAFLYIAERYGLMPAIDRWVIRTVISSLADGTLPRGAVVAVNLSARSLTGTGLLAQIESLLDQHQVPAAQLIFEVAEVDAIAHLERVKRLGRGLERLGCGLALDDFGTGFGSFFHLKHLAYGYIKIDGELIQGMLTSTNDRLLVAALVSVAKGMHKTIVAEAVGDADTATVLRELGVDFGQGYHFGEPLAMETPRHPRP